MKLKLAVFTALASALIAGPLAAQIPSSTSEFRPNPQRDARTRGAIELKRNTECVVNRRDGYGQSMITARPGSSEESRIAPRIMKVMENCLSDYANAMLINWGQLRGALAEEFYLRAFPADPDFAAMAHPVVPLAPAWVGGDLSEADRILLFQHEFANCVVAAAPADAAAMLRTGPRSPEERRVVARISPALGPCLQTGKTFQLDAAILRALLAEALYRSARQWTGMASVAAGVKP